MVELNEIKSAVARHQSELTVTDEGDFILLSGPFVVSAPDGPYDSFNVEIRIFPGFPQSQPHVFEVGGRIPRHIDRHIYPSHESCCLGVWEEFLCSPDFNFDNFLTEIVHDYFVSQSYFEEKGEWPFGERSHGKLGVLESYADILGVEKDAEIIADHLRMLSKKELRGHHSCPCGSGERLRKCHRDKMEWLRLRINPPTAKRMLLQIEENGKKKGI